MTIQTCRCAAQDFLTEFCRRKLYLSARARVAKEKANVEESIHMRLVCETLCHGVYFMFFLKKKLTNAFISNKSDLLTI